MRLHTKEKGLWLVPLILTLIIWEFMAVYVVKDPLRLPSVTAVIFSFYERREDIIPDILVSFLHFVIGVTSAFAVALPLAIAMGWYDAAFKAVDPVIEIIRPIPPPRVGTSCNCMVLSNTLCSRLHHIYRCFFSDLNCKLYWI